MLALPLSPKREQIVMNIYSANGQAPEKSRKEMARNTLR